MVDFIRVPPDSTGKRVLTMEHEIDGVPVEIQAVHIVDHREPVNGQYVDNQGAAYVRFAEGKPVVDPANRLKVVNSTIIGVYEFTNDGYDDLFFDSERVGGSIDYSSESSFVSLKTTTASGSAAVRTSNRYHYYQPGCPMLVYIVASVGDTGKVGNKRAMGLFDDNNGWFFELSDQIIYVVQRESIGGTFREIRVPQSEWSNDKGDGTGLSGVTINPMHLYTFFIDITWPVGAIRFGLFSPAGERVILHQIENSGAHLSASTQTASLPVRFSNVNYDETAGGSELRAISAVVSAQGETNYTFWRYGGVGGGLRAVSGRTPVLSVKSKKLLPSGEPNHINVFPEILSVYVTGGPVRLELVSHSELSDLLTDATWALDVGSTIVSDYAATAIDDTDPDFWVFASRYAAEGVCNLDLRPYYELNDEGILMAGDGVSSGIISFCVTPLDPEDEIQCALDLSTRELW